jgi:hypothetical protein
MGYGLTGWANKVARWSPLLVAAVATVGLSISLLVLVWSGAGAELSDRATVSGAIATAFALVAAIVAISAGVWVTTSDYKAEQAVKADTARIRAALRSILAKGALLTQKDAGQPVGLDFKTERKTLNDFLSSTTAFGYWAWVEDRGKKTPVGTEEPWRAFFLYVASLLDAGKTPADRAKMLRWAAELESLLATLKAAEIDRISSYVADLAGALGTARESSDTLLTAVRDVYGRGSGRGDLEVAADGDAAVSRRKFGHLRAKGVADPNVDMFIAVFDNDVEGLRVALDAGANTSVTDREVLSAHEADLRDFDPAAATGSTPS